MQDRDTGNTSRADQGAQEAMAEQGAQEAMAESSQVTFIYIALLTIQIVSKQLHNVKIGK